jgi:FdhD protein
LTFRSFEIKRYRNGTVERALDSIAAEEPLAIRLLHWRKDSRHAENLAVTMRTPGADKELAIGLLLTEGVIQNASDIVEVRSIGTDPSNEVLVELARSVDFDEWRQRRNGFVSSSCGVCGKASVDQIAQAVPQTAATEWRVNAEFMEALPAILDTHQPTFHQTGGVHAAALVSLDGQLVSLFEDIGRHNALDKVMGASTLAGLLPLNRHVVFMSSRSSFELIQKAAMAGVQMLASVGGPSSLAVETARALGITLVSFVRERRFNVYSGDWRLNLQR